MDFPYTQKTFYPLSFRLISWYCSQNIWLVRNLLFSLLLTTCISGFAQSYQPLSVSGFNHDVVANGPQKSQDATTVDLDNVRSVLYEKGYSCSPLNLMYGLPTNRVINSSLYSGLSYQLADYSTNNALVLRNPATSTGVLTLGVPGRYSQIVILAASTEGTSTFEATLNFADGTSTNYTFTIPDWICQSCTNYAVTNLGRLPRTTDCSDYTNPGEVIAIKYQTTLYDNLITLNSADKLKQLQSITFTASPSNDDSKRTYIMAVTGANPPSAPSNVSATRLSTSSFQVSWPAVQGAQGYNLDVSTDPSFSSFVDGYNNYDAGNSTTTTLSNLSSITYYVRVRARNTAGVSVNSDVVTVGPCQAISNLMTTVNGGIGCGSPSAQISVTASGATSFTLLGPAGYNQVNSNGVFSVNAAGTYTALAGQAQNSCPSTSTTVIVNINPLLPSASQFAGNGELGNNKCSVQLQGLGFGERFEMTGPGSYIFSKVTRTVGSTNFEGLNVVRPGTYTLRVYIGSCVATYTTTVRGNACSGQ